MIGDGGERGGGAPCAERAQLRRAMAWSALLVFVTTGYMMNDWPGWNVNTQFALTVAIVEQGTIWTDAYIHRPEFDTGDKAVVGGRHTSDKSPVLSLLGVPPYALWHFAARMTGRPVSVSWARWWTTWWTVGVSAAALAALLTLALVRRGVGAADAARMGALWVAATPLLGYSILFFGYSPVCALALGGLLLVDGAWRGAREPSARRYIAGGALLGLAIWLLNTLGLAAVVLTAALAAAPPRSGGWWRGRLRRLTPWALGGIAGVAGYFIYNRIVFGTFGSAYRFEADPFFREMMSRGFMGATWPRPRVAWLVTLHPFQGLLLWFPVTALALGGCGWLLARGWRSERIEAGAAAAFFLLLLAYVSGYFMWWGGWAHAPRHLLPALAWLPLGLAPLLTRGKWRRLVWVCAAAGVFWNLGTYGLDPQPTPGIDHALLLDPSRVEQWPMPLLELQKHFWAGQTSPNWGTRLGMRGPWSLLPLAALWVAALAGVGRWTRGRQAEGLE